MKKILVGSLQLTVCLALALTLGVQFGIRLQARHEESLVTTVAQSGRIAVVNQDLGALYKEEELYLAASIIETLGEDFALVSKAMAETGLANGNFSAVISFPADFSGRIVQINSVRPEAAVFSYQVNPNLSQSDTIRTLLHIIDLEQHINETVSYMFMASILGELHTAQATAGALRENNEADLSAVQTFVTGEMVPSLAISQMDRNLPEITHPDFLAFIEENSRVLSEINSKYTQYMEQAKTDYGTVVQGVSGSVASAGSVSDAIGSSGAAVAEAIGASSEAVSGAIGSLDMLPEEADGSTQFDLIQEAAWQESQLRFDETSQAISQAGENLLEALGGTELQDKSALIAQTPEQLMRALPDELVAEIENLISSLTSQAPPVPLDSALELEPVSASSQAKMSFLPGRTFLTQSVLRSLSVSDHADSQNSHTPLDESAQDEDDPDPPPAAPAEQGDGDDSVNAELPETNEPADGDNPDTAEDIGGNYENEKKAPSRPQRASGSGTMEAHASGGQDAQALRNAILSISLEVAALQHSADAAFYSGLFAGISEEIEHQFERIEAALAEQAEAEKDGLYAAAEEMTAYVLAKQEEARSYLLAQQQEASASLLSRQTEASGTLSGVFTSAHQSLTEASQKAAEFDPARYVNEGQTELTGLFSRFGESNRDWSVLVNEAISDRTEQVFRVFTDYDEYVYQLQDDMRDVVVGTEGRLDDAQGQLLDAMTGSYNQNNQLIGGFETVLSNSRIGAQANSDFYSFLVTPVRTEEVGGGTQAAFAQMERKGIAPINLLLPYIMIALLLSFAVIGIVGYGFKRTPWKKTRGVGRELPDA